jgi:hypothetical protein
VKTKVCDLFLVQVLSSFLKNIFFDELFALKEIYRERS